MESAQYKLLPEKGGERHLGATDASALSNRQKSRMATLTGEDKGWCLNWVRVGSS